MAEGRQEIRRRYGHRWEKIRAAHLKREPLCRVCKRLGHINAGTPEQPNHVDHIIPLSKGGTSDDDNLQTLCHQHHSQKTNAERRGRRWKLKGCGPDGMPIDPDHPWFREPAEVGGGS